MVPPEFGICAFERGVAVRFGLLDAAFARDGGLLAYCALVFFYTKFLVPQREFGCCAEQLQGMSRCRASD